MTLFVYTVMKKNFLKSLRIIAFLTLMDTDTDYNYLLVYATDLDINSRTYDNKKVCISLSTEMKSSLST